MAGGDYGDGEQSDFVRGRTAPLTITLADQSWFIGGIGVSDISADKCWVHTTNPGGKNYYFVGVRNGAKIRVTNCNSTDLPLVYSGSLGAVDRMNPDKGENGMSSDIEVTGNTVTLPAPEWRGKQASGVLAAYTEGLHVAHNHFERMNHGVQYWGGDAHGKGVTITSKRLAGQILIEENTCAHVWGACYWGSMGHDVTFQNNTADDCGDVCIDAEGSTKVTMAGNTVEDGHNGGLATFFFNEKVMITRNAVTSTNAKYPLLRTWNSSQSPDMNVDTEVFGNEFNCRDDAGTCRILFESTNGFSFLDNHLVNTVIRSLNNQKNVAITHNTFRFTRAGAAPLQPIFLSGQMPGGISRIVNNTVIADPSWIAGGGCIATPGPARYLVSGNTCGLQPSEKH